MSEIIRRKLINLKVNSDEYARIEEQARLHAGGNISLWLRTRGMTSDAMEEDEDDFTPNEDPNGNKTP